VFDEASNTVILHNAFCLLPLKKKIVHVTHIPVLLGYFFPLAQSSWQRWQTIKHSLVRVEMFDLDRTWKTIKCKDVGGG